LKIRLNSRFLLAETVKSSRNFRKMLAALNKSIHHQTLHNNYNITAK